MFDIVDMFATAYGWSKRQILEEVYYDEIEFYSKRIIKKQITERITDTAISNNTRSKDPNKLVKAYQKKLQELDGKSYLHKERMTASDERQLKEIARLMRSNAEKRRG